MMINGQSAPLRRESMDLDPIKLFVSWFAEAEQAGSPQPDAMTLATSSREGKPSARIVLLRGVDERGFIFFTNYESRKAQELSENPFAALVFHWLPLSRQVRIEGPVEQLETSESAGYFANRPRGRQLAAHASNQSQVITDRLFLDEQFKHVSRKFAGKVVPRPPHWGGYRLSPESMEFWQEGTNRLHDRLRYRRNQAANWVLERLAP